MIIFTLATTFFFIANPIGNSPAITAMISNFDFAHQKRIMLRETIFSFLIAIFFQYLGTGFLIYLGLQIYAVGIGGGILLLLVATDMIFFPSHQESEQRLNHEPIIVPIATPLISGPCLMSVIMLNAHQEGNMTVTLAIALAWAGIATVLLCAPYINKLCPKKVLEAMEQLMGLILAMMGVDMIIGGITNFARIF